MLLTFDSGLLNREIANVRRFMREIQDAGSGQALAVQSTPGVWLSGVVPDTVTDPPVDTRDVSIDELQRVDQALDSALAHFLRHR